MPRFVLRRRPTMRAQARADERVRFHATVSARWSATWRDVAARNHMRRMSALPGSMRRQYAAKTRWASPPSANSVSVEINDPDNPSGTIRKFIVASAKPEETGCRKSSGPIGLFAPGGTIQPCRRRSRAGDLPRRQEVNPHDDGRRRRSVPRARSNSPAGAVAQVLREDLVHGTAKARNNVVQTQLLLLQA